MKGQQSIEAFVAFAVILMIYGMVMFSAIQKQEESNYLTLALELNTECAKLSGDFYSAFLLGEGTEIFVDSKYDFTIVNNTLYISNTICNLHCSVINGTTEIFEMDAGTFKIKNIGRIVVVDV